MSNEEDQSDDRYYDPSAAAVKIKADAIAEAMAPKKSIVRLCLELWGAVIFQTLVAAIGLALIFELILPFAEVIPAAQGTIRQYLVYGLITVPLKIIFK